MHIVIGLILVAVGSLVSLKSEAMLKAFGRIPSFEKYFGTEGGSRLFFQLLGVALIIAGFLSITGILQRNLFSFLFPYFQLR